MTSAPLTAAEGGRTAYLSGPMRGLPRYNFDAFHEAHAVLEGHDYEVVNPAFEDELEGFDPDDPTPVTDEMVEIWMRRDLRDIADCSHIAFLPGWENSKGARIEATAAKACGLEPLLVNAHDVSSTSWDDLADVFNAELPNREIHSGEIRVVEPTTGGEKGQKPERYDLLPIDPLAELARVYGYGATKYAAWNWAKGYSWGLSYAALQRHLSAFWNGETNDPESGRHHLAHAAFHCFTLIAFTHSYPELDDRPSAPMNKGTENR